MKNLFSKLCTVLVVVLIVAGAGVTVELLTLLKGLAINDDGPVGTLIFGSIGLVFICTAIYFLVRKPKIVYSEKEASKQSLLKENAYNEIKKRHSV